MLDPAPQPRPWTVTDHPRSRSRSHRVHGFRLRLRHQANRTGRVLGVLPQPALGAPGQCPHCHRARKTSARTCRPRPDATWGLSRGGQRRAGLRPGLRRLTQPDRGPVQGVGRLRPRRTDHASHVEQARMTAASSHGGLPRPRPATAAIVNGAETIKSAKAPCGARSPAAETISVHALEDRRQSLAAAYAHGLQAIARIPTIHLM